MRAKAPIKINLSDALTAPLLFLLALPGFIGSIYTVPFQIGADEAAAVYSEQDWLAHGARDLFGLSPYFGFTYFHFLVQAWLAKLMGGVNLYHMRLVHGLDGALIVLLAYIFFRILGLRWLMAVTATIFIASNHGLIGISRIAFTMNFPLAIELIACSFLFWGMQRRCIFTSYIGGLFIGLAFYQYYAARVVLPVWLLFLAYSYFFGTRQLPRSELLKLAGASALGLALTVAPLALAHIKQPNLAANGIDFQKQQCMLFPEGREVAIIWAGGKVSTEAAILHNIVLGLTVFNANEQDHGYEYQNPGHGFVDPLSGVLIWLGFLRVLTFLSGQLAARFMLSGFLLQIFLFSFIVTKAPNYTRLLVVLPFAAYFVAWGLDMFATAARNLLRSSRGNAGQAASLAIFLLGNLTIIASNFFIYQDYVRQGAAHGDPIGGTARYMEARRHQPEHLFITAASVDFPYYFWEDTGSWYYRMKPFLASKQHCCVMSPEDLTSVRIEPPFSIFMDGKLWALKGKDLLKMYPHLIVHKIYSDTQLIAVEDPDVTANSKRAHDAYRAYSEYLPKIQALLTAGNYVAARRLCLYLLKTPDAMVNGTSYKATLLMYLGIAYTHQHCFEEAERTLKGALSLYLGLKGKQDLDSVRFYRAMGDLYFNWQRWADAQYWYAKFADTQESIHHSYEFGWVPSAADARRYEGFAFWKQGKRDQAIAAFQRGVDYYKGHPLRDDSDRWAIAKDLELCRSEKEQLASGKITTPSDPLMATIVKDEPAQTPAATTVQAVEEAGMITTIKGDQDLGRLYAKLGLACLDRRDYLEAERAYHQAAAVMARSKKPDDEMAQIYGDLGYVYVQLARFREAEESYRKAINLSSNESANRQHYERDLEYAQYCLQKAGRAR
jgi:tetratricopeptide (TPR) repeat protein